LHRLVAVLNRINQPVYLNIEATNLLFRCDLLAGILLGQRCLFSMRGLQRFSLPFRISQVRSHVLDN
jgi:hypothetical protein